MHDISLIPNHSIPCRTSTHDETSQKSTWLQCSFSSLELVGATPCNLRNSTIGSTIDKNRQDQETFFGRLSSGKPSLDI